MAVKSFAFCYHKPRLLKQESLPIASGSGCRQQTFHTENRSRSAASRSAWVYRRSRSTLILLKTLLPPPIARCTRRRASGRIESSSMVINLQDWQNFSGLTCKSCKSEAVNNEYPQQ